FDALCHDQEIQTDRPPKCEYIARIRRAIGRSARCFFMSELKLRPHKKQSEHPFSCRLRGADSDPLRSGIALGVCRFLICVLFFRMFLLSDPESGEKLSIRNFWVVCYERVRGNSNFGVGSLIERAEMQIPRRMLVASFFGMTVSAWIVIRGSCAVIRERRWRFRSRDARRHRGKDRIRDSGLVRRTTPCRSGSGKRTGVDSGGGARCNGRPKGRPYERVGGRIGFAAGDVGDDDLLGRVVPVAVVVEAGGVGAGGGHDGGGSGSDVAGLFENVLEGEA